VTPSQKMRLPKMFALFDTRSQTDEQCDLTCLSVPQCDDEAFTAIQQLRMGLPKPGAAR
jgi:hypothetical protein